MKPNFFTMMIYPTDGVLNAMLSRCLDSGIREMTTSDHWLYIEFSNGVVAKLWNANKWYAWISEGQIGIYSFDGVRPRKKTMRRLRRAVMEYHLAAMKARKI